jgi:thiol-disulfide isomerase/thioredoxin
MIYRLFAIVVVIGLAVSYAVYQRRSLDSVIVSDRGESILSRLPEASFETLDGKEFRPHELYDQESVKLLIVHYWGTWCAPCEAELPDLLALIKRYADTPGVKFLLVAVNDELRKVEKHIKAAPVPKDAPIIWLLDNRNVYKDIFGTTRVPETFVFSSDKSTLRKYVGPQQWNKPLFFQSFDEFLQISERRL